jgi:hypothetical protein
MSSLCSDLSAAADEPLTATASIAEHWLLLEVAGAWPRDVADEGALPTGARRAVDGWLGRHPRSRLQFIRRLGPVGDSVRAFIVTSRELTREVRRVELGSLEELHDVDLDRDGDRMDGSVVLVCGHGSRDRCCALRGTPVYTALAERLGEEELWISSHQGGHRFAANLLVLPAGLQFGRVPADDAPLLAARALAGRIDLDHYRGRTCYDGPAQAAEVAVRREAGLEGVTDLSLHSAEDGAVTFRTWAGAEYTVLVGEQDGPVVPASCGVPPEAQRHFRAASVMQSPSIGGADTPGR